MQPTRQAIDSVLTIQGLLKGVKKISAQWALIHLNADSHRRMKPFTVHSMHRSSKLMEFLKDMSLNLDVTGDASKFVENFQSNEFSDTDENILVFASQQVENNNFLANHTFSDIDESDLIFASQQAENQPIYEDISEAEDDILVAATQSAEFHDDVSDVNNRFDWKTDEDIDEMCSKR